MIFKAGKSNIHRVGWQPGDPGELMLQFQSEGCSSWNTEEQILQMKSGGRQALLLGRGRSFD